MNIKLVTLSFLTLFGTSLYAQRVIDKANCRDGEAIEYCLQHKKMAELAEKNPLLYQAYLLESQAPAKPDNFAAKSGVVYTIPVVFHVLHQGGEENISMAQIQSCIDVMNTDYRRLNADADNVHVDFQGLPADVEIEFALATKAPNGACFSGVTRTSTALTFNGSDGEAQVNAVINGNDVFQGQWAPNKYMNIFVCEDIGGAAGYTFQPGGWSGSSMFYNGIFAQHTYTGSIGTSSVYTSRTLTHEVGHWLNLAHTWGNDNDPGISCGTDNVTDTPQTRGVTSCNLNENFCGPRANVENYMDYSYCSKMFTPGQATRMRNALTSSTAGRNNLWTPANITATGAGEMVLCKADFAASKTILCAGDEIQFTDGTYNAAVEWTWSFPGGTPDASIEQNPTVTYSTPGTYQVVLTASDGVNDDVETKVSYITVLENSASIPFHEGFESYTTIASTNNWSTVNPGSNNTWEITTTAGHTGSKSVKLTNFGQPAENIDELVSSSVDLSASTSVSQTNLSFRYAYRKRTTGDYETLKVFMSGDCGDSWVQKKTIPGSQLSTLTSNTTWTPTSSDWVTVHIQMNNTSYNDFFTSNFRYKFHFDSDGGNNIYIDDINIYNGTPSNDIVTGTSSISENEVLNSVTLFPNPSSDDLNVEFSTSNNQAVQLVITDITGKVIYAQSVNASAGTNLVMIDASEMSQGLYFVNVQTNGLKKALQFIKK